MSLRRRLDSFFWRISLRRWRSEQDQRRRQGTALQAIEFAVQVDDHYDRLAFLESWLQGELSEWGDYQPWLSPMPGPEDARDAFYEKDAHPRAARA